MDGRRAWRAMPLAPADDPPSICLQPPPPHPSWAPEAGLYIVRFRRYAPAAAHRASVAAALRRTPRRAWAWTPRSNPAAAHPTDFGLVRLTPRAKVGGGKWWMVGGVGRPARPRATPPPPLFQAALAAAPSVRDIHPERKLTRALAWVEAADPRATRGSAVADFVPDPRPANASSSNGLWADAGGAVRKRPGR